MLPAARQCAMIAMPITSPIRPLLCYACRLRYATDAVTPHTPRRLLIDYCAPPFRCYATPPCYMIIAATLLEYMLTRYVFAI